MIDCVRKYVHLFKPTPEYLFHVAFAGAVALIGRPARHLASVNEATGAGRVSLRKAIENHFYETVVGISS